MSLSAWEQEVLESIGNRLTGSDPQLASLLATFTRLTSGEEMPVREDIRAGWRQPTSCPGRDRRQPPSNRVCRLYQLLGWRRAVLLLVLITVIGVLAAALDIHSGGRELTCTGSWALVCAQQAPAHSSRPAAPKRVASRDAAGTAASSQPPIPKRR